VGIRRKPIRMTTVVRWKRAAWPCRVRFRFSARAVATVAIRRRLPVGKGGGGTGEKKPTGSGVRLRTCRFARETPSLSIRAYLTAAPRRLRNAEAPGPSSLIYRETIQLLFNSARPKQFNRVGNGQLKTRSIVLRSGYAKCIRSWMTSTDTVMSVLRRISSPYVCRPYAGATFRFERCDFGPFRKMTVFV